MGERERNWGNRVNPLQVMRIYRKRGVRHRRLHVHRL